MLRSATITGDILLQSLVPAPHTSSTMILTTASTDYFGGDVDDGHYNSVSSAEACQQDCQVDRYCNLSSNNDDTQWKTITCHTFLTVREAFKYYFADIFFNSKIYFSPKNHFLIWGSPRVTKTPSACQQC